MRVLFICKINECYGKESYFRRSSGLYNSTQFIVQGLKAKGVHAHIVEVVDNNDIDREVYKFKPHLCVIEALWVVPEKFDVLKKLHPNTQWLIHLHSNMPFLALEGMAMDWIFKCRAKGVEFIANSPESFRALSCVLPEDDLAYLPNVYIPAFRPKPRRPDDGNIHIGCFGAVRPMKNHLLQALAAIRFASESGKFLFFHINATRLELMGGAVLKNLVALFDNCVAAELVHHDWFEPKDFIHHLGKLDLGMQVSLTETFNVVSADYVTAGLPMVVSKEVKWASDWSKCADDDVDSVVEAMGRVLRTPLLTWWNQKLLMRHSLAAQEAWFEFVKDRC